MYLKQTVNLIIRESGMNVLDHYEVARSKAIIKGTKLMKETFDLQ